MAAIKALLRRRARAAMHHGMPRLLRTKLRQNAVAALVLAVTLFSFCVFSSSSFLYRDGRSGSLAIFSVVTLLSGFTPRPRHPVELLHEQAQARFDALLARQSRTPAEAELEYGRRYGRKPPPGFAAWAEYALARGSPIIDDFDLISEGTRPFLGMNASEVLRLVGAGVGMRAERYSFSRGLGFKNRGGYHVEAMTEILGDAKENIPDVDFLVNTLDEPSVLVSEANGEDPVPQWSDISRRPIRDAVEEACRVLSNTQINSTSTHSDAAPKHEAPRPGGLFVEDVSAQKDICQHPEYHTTHGFLFSPTTLKRMSVPVPLLSQAAPSPFSDILFPAPCYAGDANKYNESLDPAWEDKENVLYWQGSLTGGWWHSSSPAWRRAHRQRFVALAQHHDLAVEHTYLAASRGRYRAYRSAAFDPGLYNVSFGRAVQCDMAACDAQREAFGIPEPGAVQREVAWKAVYGYRFLFDIDGNSYTGRFYQLLASRGTPLKMTLFREWHDERLVPWLHYVPVSLDMEEVPELVRFLTSTPEGQEIGRRIAEAGREWFARAMAPAHQGIYLYRLLLELAWLQDEERQPGE